MTITLTYPTIWGLLAAVLTLYTWVAVCSEEGSKIPAGGSIAIAVFLQAIMFLIAYGFFDLLGM